ncbi:hypothetical protein DAEQUDRAFT_727170 [Daedalea quercina L-15889]|uniref:Ribosomal protein S21 n=1 Tax=Daedalea quercina L-15889 TaxID=1314783 RepID=A0A165Q4C5_9APHY|nr:hypothetical protein DAEQUDRAFT_727170 [Daedalea quercina L-15889]
MLAAFVRRSGSFLHDLPAHAAASPSFRVRSLSSQPTYPEAANATASPRPVTANWNAEDLAPSRVTRWAYVKEAARQMRGSMKPVEDIWRDRERALTSNMPKPPGPYDGRSAWVHKGDVAQAFSRVAATLKHNAVQRELWFAKRHERRGEKRNRMRSVRHRKRFAHEVRMKVKLVQEIRARGA